MKSRLFGLLFAGTLLALPSLSASAEQLSFVTEGSKIEFVGSKPDGTHSGGFKSFKVNAIADFDSPERSSINIQIDTTSLWSDDERLTNHLKSPDFFDVRKHPAITFESTQIIPGDEDGKATIKGKMEMLGKVVEMDIPVEAKVSDDSMELTAKFEIDRTKWGMTYGQGRVDNVVKISVLLKMKR